MAPPIRTVRGSRITGVAAKRFNADAFLQSLDDLGKAWSPEKLQEKANQVARDLLKKAIDSPIPRDTGALAASGTVVPGPKPGQVTFGFNMPYAVFQDTGTVNLPPKFYGSPIGPNFYFSETIKRFAGEAFAKLARLAEQDLLKIAKKSRRRK